MSYVPLNIQSGYSFLSSTLKIEDIFMICQKYQYTSFAINDLNSMCCYSDIFENIKKYSLKPIFGASIIYLLDKKYPLYLSCYIKNTLGYLNLAKIISTFNEGIDLNSLKKLSSGLIGVIPTISNQTLVELIKENKINSFTKEIQIISDSFDDFYFGIEVYKSSDIELISKFREFCDAYSYKTVAFNKHLYLEKKDSIGLDILKAIKNDQRLTEKKSNGPFFFLKSNTLDSLYLKNEIEASNIIANTCSQWDLSFPKGKLLQFPLSVNKKDYIFNYCLKTIKEQNLNKEKYLSRINHELDIIEKMGYIDYFLIVQDYVLYAKNNDIPVGPGRGSAAGSLVSYLLGITEVDPLKYNLLFERFLNPERVSMPDIDIDFADYKRDRIITYLKNKYGEDRVVNIITFQTFGPKAAIRDIGRVFSYNQIDINRLANSIGRYSSFKEAYHYSEEFRKLCEDNYYLEIVKLAKTLEGLPRQNGIHAAGVILNDSPLLDSLPLLKTDNGYLTQFEAPFLEKLGYLKMDILSLTNLTLIENMEAYIKKYYNSDLKDIPLDDNKTFSILNKGMTSNIFQLESSGITKAIKDIKINSFSDIVAVLALYRPGPIDNIPLYAKNKNSNIKINYIHPSLENILKETYGVIIYQEQITQIVQLVANFDLGKADLFRRAISKKNAEGLQQLHDDFMNGSISNGYSKVEAKSIFDLIMRFANYGFNKSHTVSYAKITYKMAYIKANYPLAFYASLLNHISLFDAKSSDIKSELDYFNIKIFLPYINETSSIFVIDDNSLIISLKCIKGLNEHLIEQILAIKDKKIDSFSSFIQDACNYDIPQSAIITLINAGCFDKLDSNRQKLRHATPIYYSFFKNIALEGSLTKDELLDFMPVIPDINDDKMINYDLELQTLGVLLSGSLLENYQEELKLNSIIPIKNQISNGNRSQTKIAVIINSIRRIKTKKGQNMAILKAQDDTQEIEIVVFASLYERKNSELSSTNALLVDGYFKYEEDRISFIANEITIMNPGGII